MISNCSAFQGGFGLPPSESIEIPVAYAEWELSETNASIAITPDAKLIFLSYNRSMEVYKQNESGDGYSRRGRFEERSAIFNGSKFIRVSDDGKFLACCNAFGQLHLFQIREDDRLDDVSDHKLDVSSKCNVTANANLTKFAYMDSHAHQVVVFDVTKDAIVQRFDLTSEGGGTEALKLSRSGHQLLVTDGEYCVVYDTATGEPIQSISINERSRKRLVSPDGKLLVNTNEAIYDLAAGTQTKLETIVFEIGLTNTDWMLQHSTADRKLVARKISTGETQPIEFWTQPKSIASWDFSERCGRAVFTETFTKRAYVVQFPVASDLPEVIPSPFKRADSSNKK
ncbi:MAG: WD40 repeat domain-containing protein [Pirellulaceae bacterium]